MAGGQAACWWWAVCREARAGDCGLWGPARLVPTVPTPWLQSCFNGRTFYFEDSLKSSGQTIDMAAVWFITARVKYSVVLHGTHIKDQSGRRIPLWTWRLIVSQLGLAWSTQSPPRDLLLYSADKQTVPTVRSSVRKIQITGNILSYNPFYNSWCHLSFFLPCHWFYPLHENKSDCFGLACSWTVINYFHYPSVHRYGLERAVCVY